VSEAQDFARRCEEHRARRVLAALAAEAPANNNAPLTRAWHAMDAGRQLTKDNRAAAHHSRRVRTGAIKCRPDEFRTSGVSSNGPWGCVHGASLDRSSMNMQTVVAAGVPADETLRKRRLEVGGLRTDCFGPRDGLGGLNLEVSWPKTRDHGIAVADAAISTEIKRRLKRRRQP
jgi:hypothetical protein